MDVLINNVAQIKTKESEWLGDQPTPSCHARRTIRHKETNTVNEQKLATEYSLNFSQNTLQSTFTVDRNEILRSYPILSDLHYPKALVIMAPKHEYSSCAVRM